MGRRPKSPEQWAADRRERWSEAFALVAEDKASQRTRECVELVEREGLGTREIAERLGVATSTVGAALGDPTGEADRSRKAKGIRPCADCGAPCNTDGKVIEPNLRCKACAAKASRRWSQEKIIAAIREWAAEHDGKPPKAGHWHNIQLNFTS